MTEIKRYPCLIQHDGHPGLPGARFAGPGVNLLEDQGVEYIKTADGGEIEVFYSKSFRAALHQHAVEVGSPEEAALLALAKGVPA